MLFSLCFVLLAGYCAARPLEQQNWDHFVFTQQWPQSMCWELNYTEEEQCTLPQKTNFWTIHGLWPSYKDTHGPNFCTKDKFNESLISSVEDQLIVNWPNLKPHTGKYSFWKHEWDKHGTCALSMDELNSELKYFKTVLGLHQKYDILEGLREAGFVPSDKEYYQYEDLDEAIESFLGVKAKIMCYNPRSEPHQYLAQIEFCLDKSFHPIECPHHTTSLKAEQSLKWDSNFKNTALERKEHIQQVFKMNMHNEHQTISTDSYQNLEAISNDLHYNPCTNYKEIIYPTIDHS